MTSVLLQCTYSPIDKNHTQKTQRNVQNSYELINPNNFCNSGKCWRVLILKNIAIKIIILKLAFFSLQQFKMLSAKWSEVFLCRIIKNF